MHRTVAARPSFIWLFKYRNLRLQITNYQGPENPLQQSILKTVIEHPGLNYFIQKRDGSTPLKQAIVHGFERFLNLAITAMFSARPFWS